MPVLCDFELGTELLPLTNNQPILAFIHYNRPTTLRSPVELALTESVKTSSVCLWRWKFFVEPGDKANLPYPLIKLLFFPAHRCTEQKSLLLDHLNQLWQTSPKHLLASVSDFYQFRKLTPWIWTSLLSVYSRENVGSLDIEILPAHSSHTPNHPTSIELSALFNKISH